MRNLIRIATGKHWFLDLSALAIIFALIILA